jgi:vanillate O-demethylase monooxygenase subunit
MTYLLNTWYVGALSEEVSATPLRRELFDEPVVLYRTAAGAPVALADRCPHRFVPLSMGKVKGSELECGYHGLRFDSDGMCTANPHGKQVIPARTRVRSYPILERLGFVWIWPGDPARADSALLPDYYFLKAGSGFASSLGMLTIDGNYQLLADNLLDLSHTEYLHPFIANSEGIARHNTEFLQDGDTVIANRWKPNCPVAGAVKAFFWDSPSERYDGRSNIRWDAPSRLVLDTGGTEVGAPIEEGPQFMQVHLLTPRTEFSTHYFFGFAYDRKKDDPELGKKIVQAAHHIFATEDGPMVEAQQRAMGATSDLIAQRPVMLEPDEPAIRARRVLARLIAEERAESTKTPIPTHDYGARINEGLVTT